MSEANKPQGNQPEQSKGTQATGQVNQQNLQRPNSTDLRPPNPDRATNPSRETVTKDGTKIEQPQAAAEQLIAPPIGMDQGLVPAPLPKKEREEAFQMGLDSRTYSHLKANVGLERARENITEKPTAEEREEQAQKHAKVQQKAETEARERALKAQQGAQAAA